MAKPDGFVPVKSLPEPLARAKWLAEQMARVLKDEDVSDVAIAVALLTSGVVTHHAKGPAKVTELVSKIRDLEDRLLAKTFDAGDLRLH